MGSAVTYNYCKYIVYKLGRLDFDKLSKLVMLQLVIYISEALGKSNTGSNVIFKFRQFDILKLYKLLILLLVRPSRLYN